METKIRILIIEDSEDDTLLSIIQIKKGGYDIYYERVDSAKALKYMLKAKSWDIILSDYKMPNFNGLEALSIVKDADLDIPFIIISGTIGEEVAVEAMKSGAHDYIMKNNLRRLLPAVERELREAEIRTERKRLEQKKKEAEEALRESEERYRLIAENTADTIAVLDLNNNFIYVSPSVEKLRGYTAEETRAQSWDKIFTPSSLQKINQLIAGQMTGDTNGENVLTNTEPIELEEYCKDGSTVWVETVVSAIRDNTFRPTGIIAVTRDISKRKQAQEELHKTHEELKRIVKFNEALLSAIPTPVFYKDKEGRYLGCNRAFSEFMGVTPDQIKGKTVYELWPEEHAKVYHDKDLELIKNPERQVYEFKTKDKDGLEHQVIYSKDVFCDEFDHIAGIVGAFADITERKLVEMEIARVNRSLKMLSDSNQALIHISDETMLLKEVCRISVEIGGFLMAWVGFAEQAESRVINLAAYAGFKMENIESVKGIWTDYENEYGPTVRAIRTGNTAIVQNILSDPFYTPWRETAIELGVRSTIALPLIGEGRTFGALNIYAGQTDAFDDREVEILSELAGDLAFGIIALRTQVKRDKAEVALQKSETLYRTIINTIHDVFYRTDNNGNILMASPSILPLLGYDTMDEIIGHPMTMLWKQPEKRQVMLDQIRQDGLVYDYEVELKKKDGTPVFVSVSTSFIFDEEVKIAGIQGVLRDITKRKQVEEDLRGSEERYRLITENTADTITVFDMNFKTVYVSPSVLKIRGFTIREALTQSLDQILTPKSLQKVKDLFVKQMAIEATGEADPSRTVLLELEEYCKDGSTIWVELTTSFLRDSHFKPIGILTVTRDITGRKRAEKVQTAIYRMSEAAQTAPSLDKLFGSIHTIIAELMPARNFYIALYNAATEEIYFPYYADEFETSPPPQKLSRGLTDYVLRTGNPLLVTPQVFKQLVESGHVDSIGAPSVDWLGVPLKTQRGETIGVMAVQTYTEDIHLDITDMNMLEFVSTQVTMAIERKRAEEALHHSEEKYRTLVENLSDVIFTLDVQGCFTYISLAIEQFTGYSADQIIGQPFTRFIHTDDLPGLVASFERSLAGQQESFEFRVYNKDGTVRHVRTSSRLLLEGEKVIGLTGIMTDITERKQAEEELIKAKENAEENNRLKSAFLATMNHELRTPLNHILGFSDLMRSGIIPENITDYADIIHNSGQNLLEIIEGIFELALAEQSEIKLRLQTFKCLDLFLSNKSVLTEILEISGKKDQIDLVFNADKELLLKNITSDRSKINQVLINLFKNAVKFTKSGKIEFGLKTEESGWLTFYVEDTGIGIPENKHDIIFEFFRQGDYSHTREYGGVGIGLAISKKIAEVMKGTISLESVPGKGSKFYFKIPMPISNLLSPQFRDESKKNTAPDLHGKTVLIAEDDPMSMDLVKRYLSNTGLRIIEAANGKEVIGKLNFNPDIILMDLNMPIMDGYNATRIIKSQKPDIPVIAVTAYALSADKIRAMEAGCDGIITKPLDQRILLAELVKYLFPL